MNVGAERYDAAFPPTLELLEVRVPRQHLYLVEGARLFVTSIEYWNTRTTIRLVWPARPERGANPVPYPVENWAWGPDGVQYGMSSASGGGNGITMDEHYSTARPVPFDVPSLTIELLDLGQVTIDLRA